MNWSISEGYLTTGDWIALHIVITIHTVFKIWLPVFSIDSCSLCKDQKKLWREIPGGQPLAVYIAFHILDDRFLLQNSNYSDGHGEPRERYQVSTVFAAHHDWFRDRWGEQQALKRTEKPYHLINLVLDAANFLKRFVITLFGQLGLPVPVFQLYREQIVFTPWQPPHQRQILNLPLKECHVSKSFPLKVRVTPWLWAGSSVPSRSIWFDFSLRSIVDIDMTLAWHCGFTMVSIQLW